MSQATRAWRQLSAHAPAANSVYVAMLTFPSKNSPRANNFVDKSGLVVTV